MGHVEVAMPERFQQFGREHGFLAAIDPVNGRGSPLFGTIFLRFAFRSLGLPVKISRTALLVRSRMTGSASEG